MIAQECGWLLDTKNPVGEIAQTGFGGLGLVLCIEN